MSSVVLVLAFLEMQKASQSAFPRRRWDITIEADLFEEIARIYGYDNYQQPFQKMTGQQVN